MPTNANTSSIMDAGGALRSCRQGDRGEKVGLADQDSDGGSEDNEAGMRGQMKPEGWKVKARLLARNSVVEPELQWAKVVPERRGSLAKPEG